MNSGLFGQRWRIAAGTVRGTGHQATGSPNQDAYMVTRIQTGGDEILVAAVSDGAGSSRFSEIGSQAIVASISAAVSADVVGRSPGLNIPDAPIRWLASTRDALRVYANSYGDRLDEFAGTLLLAVIWQTKALLVQIGDGAIVLDDGVGAYKPAFWPDQGQYANLTYFVTDDDYGAHLNSKWVYRPVSRLCLFSDGMQGLLLSYSDKTAPAAFFEKRFSWLNENPSDEIASAELIEMLQSERVNSLTSDDKTLVLASRV